MSCEAFVKAARAHRNASIAVLTSFVMRTRLVVVLLSALPTLLMGYSTGPPIKRTGAAVDGGTNCSACHRTFAPANSDATGSVRITADNYTDRKSTRLNSSHLVI